LAILLLSSSISVLFYQRTASVIEGEYARIEQRWQHDMDQIGPPLGRQMGRRILLDDVETAKQLVAAQLFRVNILISVVVAIVGYVLAGFTLEPIQEAMQEQKRFISDASHELKTPLTALKTSLEVNLLDTALSRQTKTILRENLEEVTHLEELSERLLRLAKLEEEHSALEPTHVQAVIQKVQRRFSSIAKKKNIKFVAQLPDEPAYISASEPLLAELLGIFVDNAIKYTNTRGSVTLELSVAKATVLIAISDTGIGIPKQQKLRVFDRFYRASESRNQTLASGHGLGLAVAKKIIRQLNGQVRFVSTVGTGTSFFLSFKKTTV
jgi:signal transduction histidine kinase